MRRAIWLVALLLLAAGVEAQDFIRYYPAPVAGTSGGGATFTGQVIFPDGTAAAPSITGTNGTFGFRLTGGNTFVYAIAGVDYMVFAANFSLRTNSVMSWYSGAVGSATDLFFGRGGPAILQIGNAAATGVAQTIKAADSTGATIVGASLTLKGGAGTSGIANGGALILSGGDKSSTGEPGAVAIADGGTKPTCAAGIRGSIWYDAGGAGVADTFEVCAKAAAGDAYAWRILATIP